MARATFKPGAKIRRWESNLNDPKRALKQIGALMVSESQRSFTTQRFGKKRWDPRAPVNVFGIIGDFHAGKRTPPKRRFQRRPALRDTGRLAGSISFRLVGTNIVEVGTKVPYAAVHQFGGETESETINSRVQNLLWEWLQDQGIAMRRRLGWLLNKKFLDTKLKGEVPARPFLGISKRTIADVRQVVGVTIMEAK